MAGIDSIINNRADAFAGNPNGLMQRYAMSQDLLDLLALQKLKQDKEAAARSLQMQMQGPQGTVKDQLQGQVMDMTRNEVARAVAPGIQQQGQRMAAEQMQEAMSAGLPTQPAPALQGMAEGGIVGYAGPEGSQVEDPNRIVGYTPAGKPITLADYERAIATLERGEDTVDDVERRALYEALGRPIPPADVTITAPEGKAGSRPINRPVEEVLARSIYGYVDQLADQQPLDVPREMVISAPRAFATHADTSRHLDEALARGTFRGADNAREYAISDLSDAIAASEKTRGANRRRGQDELMALDALRSGAAPTGGLASSTYTKNNPRPSYGTNQARTQDETAGLEALLSGAGAEGGGAPSTYEQRQKTSHPSFAMRDKAHRRPYLGQDYVRAMENPELVRTDLDRAKAMGLIPDASPASSSTAPRTQSVPAGAPAPTKGQPAISVEEYLQGMGAPTRTPAAPAPTAPAREYSDAEINSGIAAMLGEDVRPMRREAPAQAEQPKYRSRYEDRLAAIEAEKQDKMGALIDFLLAAGASGGTNLGATLTGGGSGLRARDARLKQEEADVLKSIIADEQNQQMMSFRERELAQAAAQAAEDRALRMQLEKMGITARKEESAAEIASSEKIAAERVAMERAVQMAESSGRMNSEQAANWRARYNSASQNRETLLNAYFSGIVTGEALASLTEQINAVNDMIAKLEAEVAGSTTGGTQDDVFAQADAIVGG